MPSRSPSASVDNLGFNQGPQSNDNLRGRKQHDFLHVSTHLSMKYQSPLEDNVLTNTGGAQTIRDNGVLTCNKVNNTKGISR